MTEPNDLEITEAEHTLRRVAAAAGASGITVTLLPDGYAKVSLLRQDGTSIKWAWERQSFLTRVVERLSRYGH